MAFGGVCWTGAALSGWVGVVYDSERLFQAHQPHNSPSLTHVHHPDELVGSTRHRGGGFESEVKNRRTSKGASENFIKRFAYMDVHFQKFARALRAG